MKILIFEWGAYTYPDIAESLESQGVIFRTVSYTFRDKNQDDFFEKKFTEYLKADTYDAVFSVNFFPLVAKCCYEQNLLYLSWSYDNPLNVQNIEKTLGLPTNRVFLFDRMQVKKYTDMGFENIYHLPLAVSTRRLDKIKLSKQELDRFSSEISFVGKLYQSPLSGYQSLMSEYQNGYIKGILAAQQNLFGCYLVDDMLTDEFLVGVNEKMNKNLTEKTGKASEVGMSREALSYAIAAETTRQERLILLSILAGHHQLKLYSREENELLKKAQYMGSCGYYKEMPRIFKASKINLNITLKILQTGIPLRCIDILGAGGFLLSNYQEELAEFFLPGEEVVLYDSLEDAIDKADYYLKHEDERIEIARRGHAAAAERFSYEKQLATIMSFV